MRPPFTHTNTMAKHRQGLGRAASSVEPLAGLSFLAAQPAGNEFIFDIKPHSAQNKQHADYDTDTANLKNELAQQLAPIIQPLKEQDANKRGSVAMKVIFLIGKGEAEKDLDNMLKWFLDTFKKAIGTDDAFVSDLRAIKWRLNNRSGMIGMSIAAGTGMQQGDRIFAQFSAISKAKGKDPGNMQTTKKIIAEVREDIQKRFPPYPK